MMGRHINGTVCYETTGKVWTCCPCKSQHCPYLLNAIQYGKDNQTPTPSDDSPLLDKAGKKRIQKIVGSFLYYARSVDPTIVMALSDPSSQQSAPTQNTMK